MKEREAAIKEFESRCTRPEGCNGVVTFAEGFDAGAASVDRVEVARKAFEEARRIMRAGWCNGSMAGNAAEEAMDAVLADMEKGK